MVCKNAFLKKMLWKYALPLAQCAFKLFLLQQRKPQPCQELCVTGASVHLGPADINPCLCRCRSDRKTGALDVRFIGLLLSTLIFVPFLCQPLAELFQCFPNLLLLHHMKRPDKKYLLAVQQLLTLISHSTNEFNSLLSATVFEVPQP